MSRIALILNTIVGVIGFVLSFGVQLATVMGGASAAGEPGIVGILGTIIAALGYVLPVVFPIAIIGMWVAHVKGKSKVATRFAWSPWIYLAVLTALVALFFVVG